MELLEFPKSLYLLDTSFEILHEQVNEWLSEIAFWRDEAAFLYSLVISKTFKEVPINAKDIFEKIEKELITIVGGELDKLYQELEIHERWLDRLLKGNYQEEQNYQQQHRKLNQKFNEFEKRFKSLKKEIFKLVGMTQKITKNKNHRLS